MLTGEGPIKTSEICLSEGVPSATPFAGLNPLGDSGVGGPRSPRSEVRLVSFLREENSLLRTLVESKTSAIDRLQNEISEKASSEAGLAETVGRLEAALLRAEDKRAQLALELTRRDLRIEYLKEKQRPGRAECREMGAQTPEYGDLPLEAEMKEQLSRLFVENLELKNKAGGIEQAKGEARSGEELYNSQIPLEDLVRELILEQRRQTEDSELSDRIQQLEAANNDLIIANQKMKIELMLLPDLQKQIAEIRAYEARSRYSAATQTDFPDFETKSSKDTSKSQNIAIQTDPSDFGVQPTSPNINLSDIHFNSPTQLPHLRLETPIKLPELHLDPQTSPRLESPQKIPTSDPHPRITTATQTEPPALSSQIAELLRENEELRHTLKLKQSSKFFVDESGVLISDPSPRDTAGSNRRLIEAQTVAHSARLALELAPKLQALEAQLADAVGERANLSRENQKICEAVALLRARLARADGEAKIADLRISALADETEAHKKELKRLRVERASLLEKISKAETIEASLRKEGEAKTLKLAVGFIQIAMVKAELERIADRDGRQRILTESSV